MTYNFWYGKDIIAYFLGVLNIDKTRYLMELRALLSFMDKDEKTATLSAYTQLFEQAGAEGEDELIQSLGSPVRLVLRLERTYRNGELEDHLAEISRSVPEIAVPDTVADELVIDYADNEEYSPETEEPAMDILPEEDVIPAVELPLSEEIIEDNNPSSSEIPEEEIIEPSLEIAEETPLESDEDIPERILPADDSSPAVAEKEEVAEDMQVETNNDLPQSLDETQSEDEQLESEAASVVPLSAEEQLEKPLPKEKPSPKKKGKKEKKTARAKPGKAKKGLVFLAVVLTPFLIVLAALVLVLFLVPTALFAALAAGTGALGYYLLSYAFLSMTFMPDLLLVMGVGAAVLALALFCLISTLRILFKGFSVAYALLSRSYAKILGKEDKCDE